ncbi:hypothetical protein H6F44_08080 [Pseudanabaena sp. FACHB-1277]|uniref:Uncharacterized protein n=1 Tax=Pseudanabaena cinerea FACHB-1277 TaxID=2949581 RepID=A0A926Z7M3_9CYAN|nr:hypothetical protein [Pseudanabaena cinerea]MBD2150079.1 hypothetical protein [Pseudanabaena cinerea FACHB-1277]
MESYPDRVNDQVMVNFGRSQRSTQNHDSIAGAIYKLPQLLAVLCKP